MTDSQLPQNYYDGARSEMLAFAPVAAKAILEVGCGRGQFAAELKKRTGATTWGVEINLEAAAEARKCLDRVLIGDIEKELKDLPSSYFDYVVFNDVLEHLVDPKGILVAIRQKMVPGGRVLCSVPNVLHISVLKSLLWDRDWKYTSSGILDATHLRFFTRKSAIRLFEEAGYTVQAIHGIQVTHTLPFRLANAVALGFFNDSAPRQYAITAGLAEPVKG